MSEKEIVTKFPEPKPLPPNVYVCPRCSGSGIEMNGSVLISLTEYRYTPGSPCLVCEGKRCVKIEPYEVKS